MRKEDCQLGNVTLVSAALLYLLTACSLGNPSAAETPTLISETIPAVASTIPPLPLVFLLSSEGVGSEVDAEAARLVGEYAAQQDFRVESRESLDPGELPPETEIVILLGMIPGADQLIAAVPQVRFIAIGAQDLAEAENLKTLRLAGGSAEQMAFIAGYVSAVATDNWRVGMISMNNDDLSAAFAAGTRYFCGSCIPVAPPDERYPVTMQADPANWQTAANELINRSVGTVYLAAEMENEEIARFFVDRGVLLVGNAMPPSGLEANWIASVGVDPGQALASLPALLAGEAPQDGSQPPVLTYVNVALLSPAQQEYVSGVAADLTAGLLGW